jgi:hypothetical protein
MIGAASDTLKVRYKRPGLIRAGFRYQDLIAIEVLVRFYRDRSIYQWVELDSEDAQFGGIDDIVACRPDGRFDLLQVKFTADPAAPATTLNWAWLLARRPKGSSLLQKWSATVTRHRNLGGLASAGLRTDRTPDLAFIASLSGARVDFTRVEPAVQAEIAAQLGGMQVAQAFFASFDFHHSQPILSDLEGRLQSDVAFDLDGSAWLSFRDAVETWATLKNRPEPDGRILHEHLRQALSSGRPRPMPQDFEVPKGYQPPDAAFADVLLKRVAEADGATVLVGPPGRGKSTFLSYCVERLLEAGHVVVRHHYFLDLTDRSSGRFHYREIASSLVSQLEAQTRNLNLDSKDLAGAIGAVGQVQAGAGRLIVVVDGLDHVWREGRPKEHMAQLFAELLPLPPGVTLIVGTQPAPDQELPVKLLQYAPRAQWLELPLMSHEAVAHWLGEQDDAGRLNIQQEGVLRARTRADLAAAFSDISGGLPLHLIYAFEALVRSGATLTKAMIEALPPCPGGDIRRYYAGLWAQAGSRAQEILHVMAALPFAPPPLGLRRLFAEIGDVEALARIDHLLDHRDLGVYPFHGSLFAYVQEQAGAAAALAARKPQILQWLEYEAPAYWRWAWLWLTKAQFGDDTALANLPNRDWAVTALVAAYPIDQIITILRGAEVAAFARFDLARTLELRMLRSRIENGAEFQTDHWDLFFAAALEVTPDPYPLADLRANLLDLDPASVALVLRRSDPSERSVLARKALDEFNRRLLRQAKRDPAWRQDVHDSVGQIIAHLQIVDMSLLTKFSRQFRGADALLTAFAREALRHQEARKVLNLAAVAQGPELNAEVVAAACLEGLDPFSVGSHLKLSEDPRLHALSLLLGGAPPALSDEFDFRPLFEDRDLTDQNSETRLFVNKFFFRAFCAALGHGTRPSAPGGGATSEQTWFVEALEELADMAQAIVEAWLHDREPPTMAAFYAGLAPIVAPQGSYKVYARYDILRRAVLDVAVDLQLLGLAISRTNLISDTDIEAAAASSLWLDESWLYAFSTRPLQIHARSGAEAIALRLFKHLDGEVTQFAERTELCIRLSVFCVEHDLPQLAADALRRAANGVTSYGWRKDLFGYEVLASVELLLGDEDTDAASVLLSLAPIFDQITEFTDGDETDHIRTEFYKLLAFHRPDRAGAAYGHLIHNEQWRYADELLLSLAATLPAGPRRQAVLSTFIQPTEQRWLVAAAAKGDVNSVSALANVNRFLGATATTSAKAGAERTVKEELFDISPFQPHELDRLIAELSKERVIDRGKALLRWFDCWNGKGRGLEILKALETSKAEDGYWVFSEVYDAAFRTSMKLEGRSSAFKWLVLAHRSNSGWQLWQASADQALKRLDIVAEHYPERWREFVLETAVRRERGRDDRSPLLGMSRLVYLLLKVGEASLAKAVTGTLVATLRAETAEQPLPPLAWAE